jgi:hypothetical protein
MGFLSTMQCTTVGCHKEAAFKVNADLLCKQCSRAPLIDALRAAMQLTVACGSVSDDHIVLVADHIAELEAAQAGYIPF